MLVQSELAFDTEKRGKREEGLRTRPPLTKVNQSMAEKSGRKNWVMVNRAPVMTLWAAVVAEVLEFEHDEALTRGGRWWGSTLTPKGFPKQNNSWGPSLNFF